MVQLLPPSHAPVPHQALDLAVHLPLHHPLRPPLAADHLPTFHSPPCSPKMHPRSLNFVCHPAISIHHELLTHLYIVELTMDVVAHLQRIADRTGDEVLHETARKAHSACAKNLHEAPGGMSLFLFLSFSLSFSSPPLFWLLIYK